MLQDEIPTPQHCVIELKSPKTAPLAPGYFALNFAGENQPKARISEPFLCFRVLVPTGRINLQLRNDLWSEGVVQAEVIWKNMRTKEYGSQQKILIYPKCWYTGDNKVRLGRAFDIFIHVTIYPENVFQSAAIGAGGQLYYSQEDFGLNLPVEKSLKIIGDALTPRVSYIIEVIGIPPVVYKFIRWFQKITRTRN